MTRSLLDPPSLCLTDLRFPQKGEGSLRLQLYKELSWLVNCGHHRFRFMKIDQKDLYLEKGNQTKTKCHWLMVSLLLVVDPKVLLIKSLRKMRKRFRLWRRRSQFPRPASCGGEGDQEVPHGSWVLQVLSSRSFQLRCHRFRVAPLSALSHRATGPHHEVGTLRSLA